MTVAAGETDFFNIFCFNSNIRVSVLNFEPIVALLFIHFAERQNESVVPSLSDAACKHGTVSCVKELQSKWIAMPRERMISVVLVMKIKGLHLGSNLSCFNSGNSVNVLILGMNPCLNTKCGAWVSSVIQ